MKGKMLAALIVVVIIFFLGTIIGGMVFSGSGKPNMSTSLKIGDRVTIIVTGHRGMITRVKCPSKADAYLGIGECSILVRYSDHNRLEHRRMKPFEVEKGWK